MQTNGWTAADEFELIMRRWRATLDRGKMGEITESKRKADACKKHSKRLNKYLYENIPSRVVEDIWNVTAAQLSPDPVRVAVMDCTDPDESKRSAALKARMERRRDDDSPAADGTTIANDENPDNAGKQALGSHRLGPSPPEGEDGALVVSLPASPEPTAKRINSRKCEEVAGGGADDEARKAQRMARNRRPASTSRARKKEHLESLQAQVDRLQAENAALRRRLSAADGGGAAEDPGAAKGMGGPGVGDDRAADAARHRRIPRVRRTVSPQILSFKTKIQNKTQADSPHSQPVARSSAPCMTLGRLRRRVRLHTGSTSHPVSLNVRRRDVPVECKERRRGKKPTLQRGRKLRKRTHRKPDASELWSEQHMA